MAKEPTLRDIVEQLEEQKRLMRRQWWYAGATWGASIMVGAILLLTRELTGIFFLINYGFIALSGLAFMNWCLYKLSKVKQ